MRQVFFILKSSSPWAILWDAVFPAKAAQSGDFERRKAAAASQVQAGVNVPPPPNSRLVRISFQSPDPEWASKIANGIADSFITANLDRRFGASAYARTFLKERLEELKIELEDLRKHWLLCGKRKNSDWQGPTILGGFGFNRALQRVAESKDGADSRRRALDPGRKK